MWDCMIWQADLAGGDGQSISAVAQQLPYQALRLRLNLHVAGEFETRAPLHDLAAGCVGVVTEKRRETTEHLEQYASYAPQVSLRPVADLAQHFRRDVIGRSDG